MASSVFALAKTDQHAANIVRRLQAAGIDGADISVMFADRAPERDLKHVNSTKAPEGAAGGAAGGAIVGGALGWMAGIGALAIPGVGPLIAAGPLLAALSGAATVGTLGGIAGGLMGLGAPEYEATQYAGHIQGGSVLLSVHTDSSEEANRVVEILKAEKAESISTSSEESVPRRK